MVAFPRHPNFIDITGQMFGRLVVVEYAGSRQGTGGAMWKTRCECGHGLEVRGVELRNGNVKSCGCLHSEVGRKHQKKILAKMAVKHGQCYTAEYSIWAKMRDRCTNPLNKDFPLYGGSGVTVCREWEDSFEAFRRDMGPRPSPKHSLDRFPNGAGNYGPGNVRWATSIEQANNKKNTRWLEYRGEKMTWATAYRAAACPVSYQTFCSRMTLGWEAERALGG